MDSLIKESMLFVNTWPCSYKKECIIKFFFYYHLHLNLWYCRFPNRLGISMCEGGGRVVCEGEWCVLLGGVRWESECTASKCCGAGVLFFINSSPHVDWVRTSNGGFVVSVCSLLWLMTWYFVLATGKYLSCDKGEFYVRLLSHRSFRELLRI